MPRATAIILTYDRLHMLRRAVASARWQTHGDLEILVVANGASADTVEWLRTIDDPRVRVLELPRNLRPPEARNVGLAEATGEWVGFLDDDDLWAPDKVEAMVGAADRAGRTWAYCGAVHVDPQGEVMSGRPPMAYDTLVQRLPMAYTVPGGLSGMMWRLDAMSDGGLLDEAMTYCGDWDIALRLLAEGPPAAVERPLVGYRLHPGAWSRTVDDQRHEFDMIARKHERLRGHRRVLKSEHHRYVAAQAARAGDRRAAVGHYLRAISMGDPSSVVRLLGALLPAPLQDLGRRMVLSRRAWMAEGEAWVAALHRMP